MKKAIITCIVAGIILLSVCASLYIQIKDINKQKAEKEREKIKIEENFDSLEMWNTFDYEKDFLNNRGAKIRIVNDGYEGRSLLISGDVLNDARVYRKIDVDPDSYYKLSVMVKADASTIGKAAYISALYCNEGYSIIGTFNDWLPYEIYIHTDKDQDYINISLGIGGHFDMSKGYAYFDNFVFEKITKEDIPTWETPITFKPYQTITDTDITKEDIDEANLRILICLTIITSALFIYSIILVIKKQKSKGV